MFATMGRIQGNVALADEDVLEQFNGRKVIITVLEEEKPFDIVSDEKLSALSDSLIQQNLEAYKELAK